MNNRGFLFLAAFFMLLGGCVTEKLPPVSTYTLYPDLGGANPSSESKREGTRILMLDRIRSTQVFSSTDILYTDARYGQNSYAYSRWSDSPVSMLLLVFQQAIEKSGRFKAVVSYSSQSQADLRLETILFDFSHRINEDGTSEGVLRMRCYLIDNNTKSVLTSREFIASVPVLTKNAQGAATALNMATANVAQDLIDWLEQIARQGIN